MSKNSEIKTEAIVLKRTNYREADRILMLITPLGKKTALAKAARKEKSKLAGSIEPFTLTEMNLHEGKSEFLIVTGARCKKFYANLLKDLNKLEDIIHFYSVKYSFPEWLIKLWVESYGEENAVGIMESCAPTT